MLPDPPPMPAPAASSPPPLLTGEEMVPAFLELGITHLVWLPDSVLGTWEPAVERVRDRLRLVRVCREGEAWVLAAGLHLGGARPLVVIQNTGFFESGDALRNVLYDWKLPLYGLVGYRNYLVPHSADSAKTFTEPLVRAWGLDYVILTSPDGPRRLVEHYRACQGAGKPGVALVAEGKG